MNAPSPITDLTEAQAFAGYQRAVDAFNAAPTKDRGITCRIAFRRYLHTISGDAEFIAECVGILDAGTETRLAGGDEVNTYRIACAALDAEAEYSRATAAAIGDRLAKMERLG